MDELCFLPRKRKIHVFCTIPVITPPCLQASLNFSLSSLLNPSLLFVSSILSLFNILFHSDLEKKKLDYLNMGIKSQTNLNEYIPQLLFWVFFGIYLPFSSECTFFIGRFLEIGGK